MKAKPDSTFHSELFIDPRQYFAEMVESGLSKRKIQANPVVQNYLVNLLEFYLDARNLFDDPVNDLGERQPSTLAEIYLRAASAERAEKLDLLKKLGDRTLYISGFFGDSLERKIVDIDYYAEMGGAAYAALAQHTSAESVASVYYLFSKRFLDFVDVLTYISQQSFIKSDQSILRLYDRYVRTGSELAREKLIEMGVVALPQDQIKQSKQD